MLNIYILFICEKNVNCIGIKVGRKTDIIKNIHDFVSITENDQVTTVAWGNDDEQEVLIACGTRVDKRYTYFIIKSLILIFP